VSASHLIRGRVPGESIMSEIVTLERSRPRQSGLAKLFGVNPIAQDHRALYSSALGELLVGDALDNIGPEWDVLHVVPVDDQSPQIDHLVIGPPGVFTMWTKNFPGQEIVVDGESMLVGGHPIADIADARRQASSAAALLSAATGTGSEVEIEVEVEAVIVVVNPKRLVIRNQPTGLTVVSSDQLLRWLTKMDRRLDGAEVAYISDVSDRESTWHSPPEPVQDTQQLHRDFAMLREAVSSASLVRLAWAALAFIVFAAGVWVAAAALAEHVFE
jgi:Nuclease-related domain